MAELPTPEHSAEDARHTAEEVLARPEYADARPGPLERAWEFVVDRFNELLALLAQGEAAGVVALLVLAAGVAVALALLVRIVGRLRRSVAAEAAAATIEGRDAAGWDAAAEGHEEAGEWREALRCRYRAVLAELVAAGRIAEVPGRTAREYLREASEAQPDLALPLAEATEAFERAWYGDEPVDRDGVRAVADLGDDVRARLRGDPEPAVGGAR